MRLLRSIVRKLACVLILVILCLAGYNIALKHIYPLKYVDYIDTYTKEYDVSPTLVLAVIKSESGFDKDARSPADAAGLMQLTEETFYDVRRMVGDGEEYTFDGCWNDPEINIKYGTKYLSYLLELYNNDKIAAIAAYNAGLSNVNGWMGGDGKLQTDEIDFPETAVYVEKVLKAEKHYNSIYY